MKILLDAGHFGNYNRSKVVPEYYEAKMTWKLHLLLKAELETYENVEVLTTRDTQEVGLDKDVSKDVHARGKKATGCDLLISLHSNGCDSESVDRVSVFYPFDGMNNSKVIAQTFADEIAKLMEVSYGKACTRESTNYPGQEYYGILCEARKAGCPLYFIIEHSFHSNKKAATWLLKEENLQKLAVLEAKIISDIYGLRKKDVPELNLLDEVQVKPEVNEWYNGKEMPKWVKSSKLYVRKIIPNLVTVSTLKEGAVTGTVHYYDLIKIEKTEEVEEIKQEVVQELTETFVEEPIEEPIEEQKKKKNIIIKIFNIVVNFFKFLFSKDE